MFLVEKKKKKKKDLEEIEIIQAKSLEECE